MFSATYGYDAVSNQMLMGNTQAGYDPVVALVVRSVTRKRDMH